MRPLSSTELIAMRRWMTEKHLTQRQVAQIVGVSSNSTVNFWLKGASLRPSQLQLLLPHIAPYMEPNVQISIPETTPIGTPILDMRAVLLGKEGRLLKPKSPPLSFLSSGGLPELTVTERRGVESASAGLGATAQGFDCACRIAEMPRLDNLGLVKVSGESMLPLPDGLELVVERVSGCELLAGESSSIEALRGRIPDYSLVVYRLNDDSISLKRIRYVRGTYVPILVELHADNGAWSEENGWPYRVKKSDHLEIQGRVMGRVRG